MNKSFRSTVFVFTISIFSFGINNAIAQDQNFDLAIQNGRVMDPETGLDAIRSIGIRDGSIVAIEEGTLSGEINIDAAGLVVSPGFIDIHAHGMNDESQRLQVADGVTTALELEVGVYPVAPWYADQEGKYFTNYGASVGHIPTRMKLKHNIDIGSWMTTPAEDNIQELSPAYAFETADDAEIEHLQSLIREGIDQGALGIGMGITYTPAATRREILEVFRTGAESNAPIFIHMRNTPNREKLEPLNEVISNVAVTGASVHVVHINSSGLDDAPFMVQMIRDARQRGLDITTENYPYNASSTRLESAMFSGDWEARSGQQYSDLMWVETGERLNSETFRQYREIGGYIVNYGQKEENIRWLISQPDVIIGSDGVPFVDGRAHPRGAGTFSRVLGKYVREENLLSLMAALRKMTILPAQRLETVAPAMQRKGRIQVGADADITIFDAETIIDLATFLEPAQPSSGIMHVIVNGVPVIRDSVLNDNVHPGRPILGASVE
ncbi:MAG: amidohydrolase family protein [Gammaproteobacteria bacterium]|jgi:N-acyl-D-aspartate/D-glutamate deacylase|nr:amidohydrolase family protein [Gammaproteobacteria bacterium]